MQIETRGARRIGGLQSSDNKNPCKLKSNLYSARVKKCTPMQDENLPLSHLADEDVGDDTQRRFRYQHAYGVVLLLAALRSENDYLAVWCEHHEDLLVERLDGKYEGFQVKTLQDGPWKTNDDAFCKSIGRFGKLFASSNGRVEKFNFVTNARLFETSVEDQQHLCPGRLIAAVKSKQKLEELNGARKGLKLIATKADLTEEAIFDILKRVEIIPGPPLDGFESLIAHDHLSKVEQCTKLSANTLTEIVDRMISLVYKASSLSITDPARHYAPLSANGILPPEIAAKRVSKETACLVLTEFITPTFRYHSGLVTLKESTPDTWALLKAKMKHAGIGDFFDYMHRRAISAEELLFELDPNTDAVNQIENLVADQCDEIRLKHLNEKEPCGDKILQATIDRFETLSKEQSARVHYQPPEMLIGVAGLLAGDCKVWWSKPFDVGGAV